MMEVYDFLLVLFGYFIHIYIFPYCQFAPGPCLQDLSIIAFPLSVPAVVSYQVLPSIYCEEKTSDCQNIVFSCVMRISSF